MGEGIKDPITGIIYQDYCPYNNKKRCGHPNDYVCRECLKDQIKEARYYGLQIKFTEVSRQISEEAKIEQIKEEQKCSEKCLECKI